MLWKASLAGAGLLAGAALVSAVTDGIANRTAREAFGAIATGAGRWSADQIIADPWSGRVRVAGAAFRNDELSVHAGSLIFPLGSEAPPAVLVAAARAATNIASAEDVTIETGLATYRIKRLDLSGASLTKAELAQILDPKSAMTTAERLGKFSASAISIPELVAETKFGSVSQKVLYRDISLTDVVNGKISAASAAGASFSMSDSEGGEAKGAYGPMSAKNIDLLLAAKIMTGTRDQIDAPMRPLYESYAVDGFYFSDAKTRFEIDVKSLTGRGVKGRPPRLPWFEAKNGDQSAGGSQKRAALLFADVLDSFDVDEMDADDVRLTTHQGDKPVTLSVAHVGAARLSGDKIAEINFRNMALVADKATIGIADISFQGIDLKNLREAVAKAAPNSPGAAPGASARAAIPSIEEIILKGIQIEIAAKEPEGAGVSFKTERFGLRGSNQKDGLPTRLNVALDHFTCAIGLAEEGAFKDLAAMGYSQLDLSGRIEADFNEPKQELEIGTIALEGANMGTVQVSGLVGNVSKDLLSPNRVVSTAAALGARLRKLDLRIENNGFFEKAIAAQARSQNKSPDELRQSYAAAVALLAPIALENGPAAKAIGAAIAKFVADPKSLRLVATAPAGLGAADLTLLQTPGALLRKLEIEATANQ
ncbi:hypothetical protein [Methylocapsa aurea]|uniref:hypothetical protein n=1 Tax=Methylocapsa aurea TaxID=663610 RepID=UPI000563DD07|nr:hypothetical protein [Methylocapsa aurea]